MFADFIRIKEVEGMLVITHFKKNHFLNEETKSTNKH